MTDEARQRRRIMNPRIRRPLDARGEIMEEDAAARTALPYCGGDRATEYIRRNGRALRIVQAGYLLDQSTREPKKRGLPYRAKPGVARPIFVCGVEWRTGLD
jgi:hypothetical protein